MQSHDLFADKFVRPGNGNDKGDVEGLVGYPELNNSSFEEEITGPEHKITFSTSIGHKG